MPLPLLAVGMLALPILSGVGKEMKDNQAMLLVAGLGALWLFSKVKGPLEDLQDLKDKVDIEPEIKDFWKGVTQGRDTGTYLPDQYEQGLSPNPPTESWAEAYGDEDMLYDVPIEVYEGLKPPTAYIRSNPPPTTTAEEFGIWVGEGYRSPYDVRLPGAGSYDLRDIPGDIGGGIKKLWPW